MSWWADGKAWVAPEEQEGKRDTRMILEKSRQRGGIWKTWRRPMTGKKKEGEKF